MSRLSTLAAMALSFGINVADFIPAAKKSRIKNEADKSRMEAAQLKRERKMKRRAA